MLDKALATQEIKAKMVAAGAPLKDPEANALIGAIVEGLFEHIAANMVVDVSTVTATDPVSGPLPLVGTGTVT